MRYMIALGVLLLCVCAFAQPFSESKEFPWKLDPPLGDIKPSLYIDKAGNKWLIWDVPDISRNCMLVYRGESKTQLTSASLQRDGFMLTMNWMHQRRIKEADIVVDILNSLPVFGEIQETVGTVKLK